MAADRTRALDNPTRRRIYETLAAHQAGLSTVDLRDILRIDGRSLRRHLVDLECAGLIDVERRRGRGQANTYRASGAR